MSVKNNLPDVDLSRMVNDAVSSICDDYNYQRNEILFIHLTELNNLQMGSYSKALFDVLANSTGVKVIFDENDDLVYSYSNITVLEYNYIVNKMKLFVEASAKAYFNPGNEIIIGNKNV